MQVSGLSLKNADYILLFILIIIKAVNVWYVADNWPDLIISIIHH